MDNQSKTPLLFLVLLTATMNLKAQEWPQWRGPSRDGVVGSSVQRTSWPESLTQKWAVDVGLGHSAPVVSGGKIYQFSRQGEEEVVSCLDPDSGNILWRQSYAAPYRMNSAATSHGKGPKSTPVVANGRLYTFGISGILSCFDAATGELKWQKDFADQFPATSPLYGAAMSPLVDDGVLIAHVGGPGKGALTAFTADTGEIQWSWTGDGPGYTSPIVVELNGVPQIVTQSEEHIVGIAFATGELLWSLPFETAYVQNIVTPVVHNGNLIFSGLDKGIFAVKVTQTDSTWKTEKVWETNEHSMYMSSPVLVGDLMFGMSHKRRGQFFCINARSGESHWVSDGRQGDNATILYAGDVLVLLTTNAELMVAKATDESFDVIRQYSVAESPTWAHHVVRGNGVLVKDESTLAFWTLK